MFSRRRPFMLLEILISLFFISFFLISFMVRNQLKTYLSSEIQLYGYLIILLVTAILEFVPQYISPHFIILNNILLGIFGLQGLLTVLIGSTLGSLFGFYLGKKRGFNFINKIYNKKKITKIKSILDSHGKWFITLTAVSPLPYIPLVFGSLGMKGRNFIYFGVIPRIIGMIATWAFILISN